MTKESRFERSTTGSVRVHVLPEKRFKTFAMSVMIGTPLKEETVTRTALIPFVLRRGSRAYPETKQFRERLDDLYGAGFGFDVYKRGDYQIVQFRMDVIHDDFVQSSQSLLSESIRFLGEAITDPALEGEVFTSKYVEAEKVNLRKRLEAIVNDKIRYAAERCIAEMCSNEPYRLHPLGKIEDLDAVTPESLYAAYRQWLASSPIDLYIAGDTTLEEVMPLVKQHFFNLGSSVQEYKQSNSRIAASEVKEVTERLDVNQGKLNLGLRVETNYADASYPQALVYNGILGGYPHSKLFTNVREKASLAYYASSRLDGHKGILTIQSGIEVANYEKAVQIIRDQLSAVEAGDISDSELGQTKAMISGHLRELQDSAFEQIAFDFNNVMTRAGRSVPALIEAVEQITKQDVQQFSKRVTLDTIYFLRDRKGDV